jgi:hypothetical protein
MGNIGSKLTTAELIYTFLDRLCEPHWEYCVAEKLYDREESEMKKRQLRFGVMGMLLFYQNRLQPDNYKDFIVQSNELVEEIIG